MSESNEQNQEKKKIAKPHREIGGLAKVGWGILGFVAGGVLAVGCAYLMGVDPKDTTDIVNS